MLPFEEAARCARAAGLAWVTIEAPNDGVVSHGNRCKSGPIAAISLAKRSQFVNGADFRPRLKVEVGADMALIGSQREGANPSRSPHGTP